MWEVNCKESWALKNWCFWTVMLEKTLESPLDCKEISPVHPKVNQSWIFIGRTDAEAEAPILWSPDAKSWLIWKDPDAEKDWGQEEKGTTEDEMVWWHHWHNGHGLGWTLGVGDGQGGLACCSSWDLRESDTTERLNWSWFGCFLFLFPCVMAWLGFAVLNWIQVIRVDILVLVLILEDKLSAFTTECDLSCGLTTYGFYYVEFSQSISS